MTHCLPPTSQATACGVDCGWNDINDVRMPAELEDGGSGDDGGNSSGKMGA
jgi:hypothetical protein